MSLNVMDNESMEVLLPIGRDQLQIRVVKFSLEKSLGICMNGN